MTQRQWYLYQYLVTCPGGTAPGAPFVQLLPTGDIWCESITYRVPDGWNGKVGFYILQATAVIVPWSATPNFLIENKVTETVDVQDEVQGNLSVVMFNNGFLNHNLWVRIKGYPAVLIQGGTYGGVINPIPSENLSSAVTLAPPPAGSVVPNADGSCPIGYQLDPGGSGYCLPPPAPPTGAIPAGSGGTCPLGWMIDPGGSGYCVAAPPPPPGSIAPDQGGACPTGYVIDPGGSGYCVPGVETTVAVS